MACLGGKVKLFLTPRCVACLFIAIALRRSTLVAFDTRLFVAFLSKIRIIAAEAGDKADAQRSLVVLGSPAGRTPFVQALVHILEAEARDDRAVQGEGGEQCDSLMPAFCALAQFDALDLQHQLRDSCPELNDAVSIASWDWAGLRYDGSDRHALVVLVRQRRCWHVLAHSRPFEDEQRLTAHVCDKRFQEVTLIELACPPFAFIGSLSQDIFMHCPAGIPNMNADQWVAGKNDSEFGPTPHQHEAEPRKTSVTQFSKQCRRMGKHNRNVP
ncbi:unnamed protein product, partial [Symbiodinium sp. KB8]